MNSVKYKAFLESLKSIPDQSHSNIKLIESCEKAYKVCFESEFSDDDPMKKYENAFENYGDRR